MSITGWVCLAIYATIAAATYIPNRNATGDRAVGLIIPLLLMPAALVFAGALGFAQYRGSVVGVSVIALILTLPILFLGPVIAGNLISSYSTSRNRQMRGQFRDPVLSEIAGAIRSEDHQKLKSLLDAKPKIDWTARDHAGFTLLGIAVKQAIQSSTDRQQCLRVLVDAGAPFQDDATEKYTHMLPDLITRLDERPAQIEILQHLLRAGANPNEKDNWGAPALIGVFMEAKKAKALLDAGAELRSLRVNDGGEFQGWDPLMVAAGRARWDLALLYLERGCDPNFRAPDGKSALSVAQGQQENLNSTGENFNRNAFLRALRSTQEKAAEAASKN